jgi:hypothetical protein
LGKCAPRDHAGRLLQSYEGALRTVDNSPREFSDGEIRTQSLIET